MTHKIWIWSVALVLTMLTAINGWALQTRKITASAGFPIPTAYSSSDNQSLVWNATNSESNLLIHNGTSSATACYVSGDDSTKEPDQAADVVSEEIHIPATTQYVLSELSSSKRVWCRSDSGSAITSGVLNLVRW